MEGASWKRPGPGYWVGGLAVAFAAWNLLSLAAGGLILTVTLPEILKDTSDDWGLAFVMIAGGLGAIANFALFLPAELLFALTARNIDWRARAAIPASLGLAVLLGTAPSAVRDLRCFARHGSFPADAGIGWVLALGIGVVTFGTAALAYLLVWRQRASQDTTPAGQ
jgi:hypothetical protein